MSIRLFRLRSVLAPLATASACIPVQYCNILDLYLFSLLADWYWTHSILTAMIIPNDWFSVARLCQMVNERSSTSLNALNQIRTVELPKVQPERYWEEDRDSRLKYLTSNAWLCFADKRVNELKACPMQPGAKFDRCQKNYTQVSFVILLNTFRRSQRDNGA